MSESPLFSRISAFEAQVTAPGAEEVLHRVRSVFASIIRDEYNRSHHEGEDIEAFRERGRKDIDRLDSPFFEAEDTSVVLPGKRQPSLSESFDATLDRYVLLDDIHDVFGDSTSALAYGGSMKYGPFLNVRGGGDASYVDLILVGRDHPIDRAPWQLLMETDTVAEADKITFFARLAIHAELVESGEADIMSQRFTVPEGGFTISTHIIPVNYLAEMLPQDVASIQEGNFFVRDYKERPFERTHCTNFDMSRNRYEVPVYNRPVSGGFIAGNAAYSSKNSRYVPGMYQNLVLPQAVFAYTYDDRVTEVFSNFSNVVAKVEASERLCHPGASIQNTEPRLPIMPDATGHNV